MKKILSIVLTLGVLSTSIYAGGLTTNTNQNVHFIRMFARAASMEIDGVYSNPAGTALLEEGFQLSFNAQTVIQTRRIDAEFPLFENGKKRFEGDTYVPIFPAMQFAYKKDKWAFSGAISVIGGGGQAEFKKGLPMFEASIAALPAMLSNMGISTTRYSVNSYMNGEQYIYALQLGAAYKINDWLSAFVGGRANLASNHYDGYIKDIMINPVTAANPQGNMISASSFFTAIGQPAYATATSDMEVDVDQSGWGFTPILGLNFHLDRLNIGVKYEMNTDLEIENDTKTNTLPTGKKEAYDDGVKTDSDMPGFMTVGASYEILPSLRAAIAYHHYFDCDANLSGDKESLIDNGINEYLWGVEYDINDRLSVSGGMQFTRSGVQDDYQSDLSYSLSSYSFGFGGAYQLTDLITLNLAYFCTKYSDWDVAYANYNGTGVAGKNTYHRFSDTLGLGINFKF